MQRRHILWMRDDNRTLVSTVQMHGVACVFHASNCISPNRPEHIQLNVIRCAFFHFRFSVGLAAGSACCFYSAHIFSLSLRLIWWPCNVETSSENICSSCVCLCLFDSIRSNFFVIFGFPVIEWIRNRGRRRRRRMNEMYEGIKRSKGKNNTQKKKNKLSISDHFGATPCSLIEKVFLSPCG